MAAPGLGPTGRPVDPGSLVLVTGGCGFIGASAIRALLARRYRIRVLDDLSTGRRDFLDGLSYEWLSGDVRDPDVARQATDGADAVVHLAAETNVLESVDDPWPSFSVNVGGTVTMLRAAVDAGVRRFVLASSNAAIGQHPPPTNEAKLPRPVSPYGASKLAGEAYCAGFGGAYDIDTIALRFANAYGPYSGLKTSVVAKFIRLMLRDETLPVYGDGRQTRDFVHVHDVAQGIALAVERPSAAPALQIATGRETSVLELVGQLERVSGRILRREHLPQPAGEIRRNSSSIALASQEIGYQPRVALEDGLAETFQWLEGNSELLAGAS